MGFKGIELWFHVGCSCDFMGLDRDLMGLSGDVTGYYIYIYLIVYIIIYIYIAVVILWDSMGIEDDLALVICLTTMENQHEDNRQMSRLNGLFSIAMINYQRVGTYMCFGHLGRKVQDKNLNSKTISRKQWLMMIGFQHNLRYILQ